MHISNIYRAPQMGYLEGKGGRYVSRRSISAAKSLRFVGWWQEWSKRASGIGKHQAEKGEDRGGEQNNQHVDQPYFLTFTVCGGHFSFLLDFLEKWTNPRKTTIFIWILFRFLNLNLTGHNSKTTLRHCPAKLGVCTILYISKIFLRYIYFFLCIVSKDS